MSNDLVTIAEASRRIGLANLSHYKKVYDGFPNPHRREYPFLWKYSEIESWYYSVVKPYERKPK